MNVESVMSREPKTCGPREALQRAAQLMWEHDCGCVPIVEDDGRLVGIVTDRDACMAAYTQGAALPAITIEWVMSKDVATARGDETLESAAQRMAQREVRRLPVIDDAGRLIGVLSTADLVRTLVGDARGTPTDAIVSALASVSRSRAPRAAPAPESARRDVLVPAAPQKSAVTAKSSAAAPAKSSNGAKSAKSAKRTR